MGFGIIKRKNGNGLWLEQNITEEKFDSIVKNLESEEGELAHEWGKFYDENGNLIKGVIFK